uniref:Uncharacterized protein n=1 Tax=Fagus sylvatica TaxID=28930 RepID=A0A2N9FF52_FAGSY
MSSGSAQGSHSLAFRVMTLCKPSFHVDPPLRLDPADLIVGEDIFDDPIATYHLPSLINSHVTKLKDSSDLSYRTRFLLHDSSLLYVLYACDVDWSEINWILNVFDSATFIVFIGSCSMGYPLTQGHTKVI